MPPTKKRKGIAADSKYSLLQRLHTACEHLTDDGKLQLLVEFCERGTKNVQSSQPGWVKTGGSFLSTLDITPKEWDSRFEFPNETFLKIGDLFQQDDSWEKLTQIKSVLNDSFPGGNITERTVMELLSNIQKLTKNFSKLDLGELIVSAGMTSLLEVLQYLFPDITMNGDKQSTLKLSEELPVLTVRNDSFMSIKGFKFFLREDKSIDRSVDWFTPGTDCYKLIMCMKSELRNNMQKFSYSKEQMLQYSKVMGLSYLKSTTFLFILEASFDETVVGDERIITPKYSLYFKEYIIDDGLMMKLWLDIAYFIKNHAPFKPSFASQIYRPISETPLKNLTSMMLSTSTDKRSVKKSKRFKKYKEIVSTIEKHEDVVIVCNTSVFKEVDEQERDIILKLVNVDSYCLYLPNILNIYRNDVEFEHLDPLPIDVLDEEFLLMLAIDICVALKYLHTHNIVHRDVKPSNIMMRRFHNPSTLMWFVLIDFGLSFEMIKEQNGCYTTLKGKKALVTDNAGTGLFKAPEVHEMANYDEKIDIYSLGASILFLKNKSLFEQLDYCRNLRHNMRTLQWENIEFGKLVLQMVDCDPKARPSAEELENSLSSLTT